jgi:acetolactate synthase-1/2/3 large subunit
MWTAGMMDLKYPGQGYLRAAGSLGWGIPAALGAKLALPGRPVLLFTGDGGFWYHMAELETAARCGINVVVMINNNHSFNQTTEGYTAAYGGELHGDHGDLWQFSQVDLARASESMGARGIRVQKPRELAGALEEALAYDGPCVVEVVTSIEALAPLAWTGEGEARPE